MIPHLDALMVLAAIATAIAAWRTQNGGYAIAAGIFLVGALIGHI